MKDAPKPGSAAEVFLVAFRLGLTSFGGPIAHLGHFRDEYVVRRRWLDDHAYSELVGLCQFLPGPASSQVGFAIGWMRAGALGALAAWIAFTLPSAVLMFAFAQASRGLGGSIADAAIHGLKVAAVAVVAQAIVGMARILTPDLRRIALAAAAAAALLLVADAAAQVTVIAAGGLLGLILCEPGQFAEQHRVGRSPDRRLGISAFSAFAVLLIGLPFSAAVGSWFALGEIFYRSGALVFGGGHVVLPLLREGLVPAWMSDGTFLAGYGAAQAVPGPLFSIAGYLGAAARPDAPLVGAMVATVAIFLPGLLLVTGSIAFRDGIMGRASARRAMAGVNAVVVGILAAALCDPLWTTGIATVFDMAVAGLALFVLIALRTPPIIAVGFCVVAEALWASWPS